MSSDFQAPDVDGKLPLEPGRAELAEDARESNVVTAPDLNSADDLTRLSFLHPTSLVFELTSQVRSFLIPAALGVFGAAKGDLTFIIVSALIFVPSFLTSIFRYFTFRYCIKDDHLVVTQGLIFKSVRTIPVNRIQKSQNRNRQWNETRSHDARALDGSNGRASSVGVR